MSRQYDINLFEMLTGPNITLTSFRQNLRNALKPIVEKFSHQWQSGRNLQANFTSNGSAANLSVRDDYLRKIVQAVGRTLENYDFKNIIPTPQKAEDFLVIFNPKAILKGVAESIDQEVQNYANITEGEINKVVDWYRRVQQDSWAPCIVQLKDNQFPAKCVAKNLKTELIRMVSVYKQYATYNPEIKSILSKVPQQADQIMS